MDEPIASLDRARRDEILPFLDRLHAALSIPVIYVSHSTEEVIRLCDYLLVMERGRIVASGAIRCVPTCPCLVVRKPVQSFMPM
jgi:molybdate transport system ATP-binding protein